MNRLETLFVSLPFRNIFNTLERQSNIEMLFLLSDKWTYIVRFDRIYFPSGVRTSPTSTSGESRRTCFIGGRGIGHTRATCVMVQGWHPIGGGFQSFGWKYPCIGL